MTDGPAPSGPTRSWSASAPYCRALATLTRILPDGLLLLGPAATEPIVMTGPVADVWRLLEQPVTFDEVVTTLADRYVTDASIVAADLEAVWTRLLEFDALVPQ